MSPREKFYHVVIANPHLNKIGFWRNQKGEKNIKYEVFITEKQARWLTRNIETTSRLYPSNTPDKPNWVKSLIGFNAEIDKFWSRNRQRYYYKMTWKAPRPYIDEDFFEGLD